MSRQLEAIAEAEGRLKQGDFRGAIACYERAIRRWLADDHHVQAAATLRQVFVLDMLREHTAERLVELYKKQASPAMTLPWRDHAQRLPEITAIWPYRTATVLLAAVGFHGEGAEHNGELVYIEGADPLARITQVSDNLLRVVTTTTFAPLSDAMLISMLASALVHQRLIDRVKRDAEAIEIELRRSEGSISYILYETGDWFPLAAKGSSVSPVSKEDKASALLLEADLCASLGMWENARQKYSAVLAADPDNQRARTGLDRVSAAS